MSDEKEIQGIPIYLDSNEPEIDDPANQPFGNQWHPANDIAIKLIVCLEAIRDIKRLLVTLAEQDDPTSDKRIIKILATPLYNLANGVNDIFNDLEGNAKQYGSVTKQERQRIGSIFKQFSEKVPLRGSALRTIRDKLSSHVDRKVFASDARQIWQLVDLESHLDWLQNTIDALISVLELDVYAWTRESGNPSIFRLMAIDGRQVDLDLDNNLIVGFALAKSPKLYIANEIQELASLHRRIKRQLRTKSTESK